MRHQEKGDVLLRQPQAGAFCHPGPGRAAGHKPLRINPVVQDMQAVRRQRHGALHLLGDETGNGQHLDPGLREQFDLAPRYPAVVEGAGVEQALGQA